MPGYRRRRTPISLCADAQRQCSGSLVCVPRRADPFTGRKPFVGALAGASPLGDKDQSGYAGRRARIIFPHMFRGWDDTTPPIPVVFGSVQARRDVDGDTTMLGRGFAHWIEDLALDGFTACYEARRRACGIAPINRFAFEQEVLVPLARPRS